MSNFDYQWFFNKGCSEQGLICSLSFAMPKGYENANGMYDSTKNKVYINANLLTNVSDIEKAFYLFHELRHAEQFLYPRRFDVIIRMALNYDIGYDGNCSKRIDGKWVDCHLDGGEEIFTPLYLSQPHEIDANKFAYLKTKELFGDSKELEELKSFWIPNKPLPSKKYTEIYALIDKKVANN